MFSRFHPARPRSRQGQSERPRHTPPKRPAWVRGLFPTPKLRASHVGREPASTAAPRRVPGWGRGEGSPTALGCGFYEEAGGARAVCCYWEAPGAGKQAPMRRPLPHPPTYRPTANARPPGSRGSTWGSAPGQRTPPEVGLRWDHRAENPSTPYP